MPNQRGENQKLLPFAVKEEFVDELDAALRQLNVTNRSQFIRKAIAEKLARAGITLPEELSETNSRFGKSGPPLPPGGPVSYGKSKKKPKP